MNTLKETHDETMDNNQKFVQKLELETKESEVKMITQETLQIF